VSDALDPESFAAYMEAATRQAGFEVERREGLDLYVVLHGQSLRCDLKLAYSGYQSAPERLDEVVEVHLNALRVVPPVPPPPGEKEAAESFLPLLNPAGWLQIAQRDGRPALLHRPFGGGMVITYVFDLPFARAYANVERISRSVEPSGLVEDDLHAYALENLRKRTTNKDFKVYGRSDKTMIMCDVQDGYAATRILLPDLMSRWARRIPGRMLIGIPNRDFLIAFSDRDRVQVAAIARQVRRDAVRRDHPLCAGLFVWQDGQVREYRPGH
jgi:hypothetical protein